MKINIIWSDLAVRDAVFDALESALNGTQYDITTEIDDGSQWYGVRNQDQVNVLAFSGLGTASSDRLIDLHRSRNVKIGFIDLSTVSQDVFHNWYSKIRFGLKGDLPIMDSSNIDKDTLLKYLNQ